MKLKKIDNITVFMECVSRCKGNVYLRSTYGDVYNLKSKFSQYLSLVVLLGHHGDDVELFCEPDDRENLKEYVITN